MLNLSENEVFSEKNIDSFRKYDIQLIYLNRDIDKKLLLRALMQIIFLRTSPSAILREKYQFKKLGNIEIPEDRKNHLAFNKLGIHHMQYGIVYYSDHSDEDEIIDYAYEITVPYTEVIRELMVDIQKVLRKKYYQKVSVYFEFHLTKFCFSFDSTYLSLRPEIERDLIYLDYAMMILHDVTKFNASQFYRSIISLLETDSSGKFRDEYFSYLDTLKSILPDKWR